MAETDWSQLPPDLLRSVSQNLTIYSDYIRLRAVCLNWRSWLPPTPDHLPPQLPWLMLPPPTLANADRRCFFNLINNKFHILNLPEASPPRRVCCSSNGWLVLLNETPDVICFNPLTRRKVHLPPLSSFPDVVKFDLYSVGREYTVLNPNRISYTYDLRQMRDFFVKKIILSASPAAANDSDFIALAIVNSTGELAISKKGDTSWKSIEAPRFSCEDAVYSKGLFYCVNKRGKIAVVDKDKLDNPVRIIDTPALSDDADMRYLASMGDDLLVISRRLDVDYDSRGCFVHKTTGFDVHKLDLSVPKWEMVSELQNCSLFLGQNSSLLFPSASDARWCKRHCIYFTDDHTEFNDEDARGNHDMGIFNLIDGSIEALPCYPRTLNSTPIWVVPNPC